VHGNGNKSLKFNVSPETAQLGVFTQRIHINTLKSAKSLRLKARIFIETPENKDKKYGGIFSLRLRQWGKGAYLRDALKIYCSFDADKIRIIEKKDRRTYPRVINDYMNKWIEIESTAPVDEDARALDILCSARGNPKAVLYLDEISIEELVLPVINILQMPKAIKTGREIIPVKADVAVPANQSAIMKFNANNEVEKWSYSKDFKLSNGVQTFELPIKGIPPGKIALKFTVINSDGNILQTITEKIDCLEDPFVD
jgi:hypothetical protein